MIMRNSQRGPAHPLINYVRRQFGEHLCAFLLAGYGEDEPVRRRCFSVVFVDEATPERYLEVFADGRATPPHGAAPLVLAALFKLLFEAGETRSVIFRLDDLSKLLARSGGASIWPGEAVAEALSGYYDTSYAEVRSPCDEAGEENPPGRLKVGRLITKYDTERLEADDVGGGAAQTYVDITFNAEFVERLRRRTLFDIDWGQVASISRVPPSFNPRDRRQK